MIGQQFYMQYCECVFDKYNGQEMGAAMTALTSACNTKWIFIFKFGLAAGKNPRNANDTDNHAK